MLDEVNDTRLMGLFKKHLRTQNITTRTILKGQLYCGSQVIHQQGTSPAVFVVSNQESAKFFGLRTCRSPWACPRCSAKVMAKKGADIACAIDALLTWHNQKAFMITFTLPHTKGMTAAETFTILEKTWHAFNKAGNTRGTKQKYTLRTDDGRNRTGESKGEVRNYVKGCDPFGDFRETCEIKHFVRVYEFTWGENSWHPHIHAIFWTPNKHFDEVINYEEKLNARWWEVAKRTALAFYNHKYPDKKDDNKRRVETLYADWKLGHKSVTFSRDKGGRVRQQMSSHYVSGWSGDFEVAGGHIKTANNGHFTPMQMLEMARTATTADDAKKWLDLFTEYALATKGHRRVHFSARSGISDIIRKWKQTQSYTELLKKKFTDKATAPWKVVCWFSEKQWWSICLAEDTDNMNLLAEILTLARLPDGRRRITELLLTYGIDIRNNQKHPDEQFIESRVLNSVVAA